MELTKEILNQIKPKVKGESDKYSWNFYKYLNKQKYKSNFKVYVYPQVFKERKFNKNETVRLGDAWLSFSGSYQIASSLSTVMGKGYAETFSLCMYNPDLFTDITEWFIDEYIRVGRCIFDRDHNGWWQGTKDRFTYIGSTRRCNWCGEWHTKEIEKEVKIKRHEVWKKMK